MIAALYTVYIFCCIFLILVVLLQAGRGGGMALGGGSQQQAFGGGGAAPIMKNLTMGTAALWLVLNLVLAYLGSSRNSAADGEFKRAEAPIAAGSGATAPAAGSAGRRRQAP